MSKANYACDECGATFVKWAGKCPRCHTFGSVTETMGTATSGNLTGLKSKTAPKQSVAPARQLGTVKSSSFTRSPTGVGELDRVLGGGLVPGQVILMAGEPGVGKALALDTAVPTPTRWTTIGEIKVGDEVLGRNGEPVTVVAVSETFNDRPCYKVYISSGDVFIADANHEWLCEYRTPPNYKSFTGNTSKRNRNTSVSHVNSVSGVFTSELIYENCRTVEGFPNFHLPPVKLFSMSFTKNIDGYQLAQEMLNPSAEDGKFSLSNSSITTLHTNACKWGEGINQSGEMKPRKETATSHIRTTPMTSPVRVQESLTTLVEDSCGCPVWHPILRTSQVERLKFVQEFLKVSAPTSSTAKAGEVDERVNLKFITFSEKNVARVVEGVFRTLSYQTSLAEKCNLNADGSRNYKYILRVEKVRKPHIFFVEKVPSQPVKCIQVENKNGLFLIGENYTITHNSTILLTAADSYAKLNETTPSGNGDGLQLPSSGRVLYVSGEESVEQISLRAKRIGVSSDNIFLADETDVESVLTHINEVDPDLIVVDSVQTIGSPHVEGRVGGMAQVHEISNILTRVAKERRTPLILVGQINKSNELAGPKTLEHLVDTVLMFEGDPSSGLRLLRSVKNRFGSAEEIACFEQSDTGIHEVLDPSGLFLTGEETQGVGSATTVTMEGRRPLAVEIQALANYTNSPNPRRGVSGLDYNRVAMLIAITEKYGKVKLYDKDAFFATVGGVRITEPAADFAICGALMSTILDTPLPESSILIGEVALSGHLRKVRNAQQRLNEAKRLGYRKALIPKGEKVPEGIVGIHIGHISQMREMLT